jgi:hypothetical protein
MKFLRIQQGLQSLQKGTISFVGCEYPFGLAQTRRKADWQIVSKAAA